MTPESTGTIPLEDLAPETAEAEKPKRQNKPTDYHILKLDPGSVGANERWTIHARNVEAQGGQAAIRKSVGEGDVNQTFVAIPSRSFQPITVTVETKQQLVLS